MIVLTITKWIWVAAGILGTLLLGALTITGSPMGRRALPLLLVFAAIGVGLAFYFKFPPAKLLLGLPVALIASAVIAFRLVPDEAVADPGQPLVYDKAKFHFGHMDGLPDHCAYVHTGMFVGWLIDHDLIAGDFLEETKGFKERKTTGAQVYEAWDGCLISDMLTEEGNCFARDYFDFEHGQFLDDYEEILAKDSKFNVADTWQNYDLIGKRIDERYGAWKKKAKRAA